MKVNLKKIGAIVAGATILASSAAFAGLMFGSTTLVDDNGAPVAKVVVGSKAQPSDGVAAALIAGKMVSETYKSQTLTAQVSGTAACTSDGGNATGTCSISNEKARLEITVPGSVAAGTWTGENLIGDYLNRALLDREPNDDPTDSDQAYEMSGSDTSEGANPFTDGLTGNIGPTEEFMYKVGGEQFSVFADSSLMDDDS
ncbi:MAG: S-layer protein, partial [Candidatus Micrarchaeota archaeon]